MILKFHGQRLELQLVSYWYLWSNPCCLGPQQNETLEDWNLGLEYNKYLREVVQILEADPDFRKKLETAKVNKVIH